LVPEIRFRFWSDRANSNYEGAYIDDVMITASAYPVLDNSRELIFWTAINSSPDFNVVIKPPRILDYEASVSSILQGGGLVTQTGIQQYIQQIRPDVIVLDDLYLDMFGVWGFNETERLAIFDYIEQGHGLILTGGSLFDMRANNTYIGPYGHINRLYLEENPSLEQLRNNYKSSLAAPCGLGLLPLYEEAREWIANQIRSVPNYGPALSYIVRSLPLMPTRIPFSKSFTAENTNDPLLQGISESFSVNLESKGCFADGTSVGWQLEYPFLMASKAITTLQTVISSIISTLNATTSQATINSTHCIQQQVSNYNPQPLDLTTQQFNDIMNNVTATMSEMLENLYEMRLNTPSEFTIPINFTIGPISINEEISIPIPVELQEIVKPATIVAESTDGLAAILRYEAGNHRAVYFSFKPSLETEADGPCKQIMKNALRWASQSPELPETVVIANLGVPKTLVNQARALLNLPAEITLVQAISDTIHENKTYSYSLNLDASHAVVVYWYGYQAQVQAKLGNIKINVTKISQGNWHAAIIDIPQAGDWNISIKMDEDDPLLTPLAIEVINKQSATQTDLTSLAIVLALTQTSSGTLPITAIVVTVIAGVGVALGLAVYIKKKE